MTLGTPETSRSAATRARSATTGAAAAALLVLFSWPLLDRSAWLDEAMVLANFWSAAGADLTQPMPLYDQVLPPLLRLLFAASAEVVGPSVLTMRLLVLIACCAGLAYAARAMRDSFGAVASAVLALGTGTSFVVVYYATEIKHYGFEIAGVLVLAGWLLSWTSRQAPHLRHEDVVVLALGLALGVSTLIPFAVVVVIVLAAEAGRRSRDWRHHVGPASLVLLGMAHGAVIDRYAVHQRTNYFDVYEAASELPPWGVAGLFGQSALLAIAVSCACFAPHLGSLRSTWSRPADRRRLVVLVFVIGTVAAVLGAAWLDLYPVAAARHVAWLTPLAFVLLATASGLSWPGSRWPAAPLCAVAAVLVVSCGSSVLSTWRHEGTDNERLYRVLAEQEPSDVLVHLWATPSLEVYRRVVPELDRHRYRGLVDNRSGPLIDEEAYLTGIGDHLPATAGAWGSATHLRATGSYTPYSEWLVAQAPARGRFLVLVSHYDGERLASLLEAFDARRCRTRELHSGPGTLLLEGSCG